MNVLAEVVCGVRSRSPTAQPVLLSLGGGRDTQAEILQLMLSYRDGSHHQRQSRFEFGKCYLSCKKEGKQLEVFALGCVLSNWFSLLQSSRDL